MKKALTSTLALLMSCGFAYGAETSGSGYIKNIQTNGWNTNVILDTTMKSAGCNNSGVYVLKIDESIMDRSQLMYSTVLAAYMGKKKIKFWLNGCIDINSNNYPLIKDVTLGENI